MLNNPINGFLYTVNSKTLRYSYINLPFKIFKEQKELLRFRSHWALAMQKWQIFAKDLSILSGDR